jgi:N6-adenosine-specific RNA methylase IME4
MTAIASSDDILTELRAVNSARGEAVAFTHVAGYTLKLGFDKIEWLLEGSRWRQCGFDTIEAFGASIQFDKSLKLAAEKRKKLAVLFEKEKLSNRKIATALNVRESTIRRDTAPNGAPGEGNLKQNKEGKNASAPNGAPALLSGERAAKLVANKAESQEAKLEKRETRERATADRILALPDKKYGVLNADPEWRDEVWSRDTGLDRAPDNHYSTSPEDIIKSRPVASIAADDSVLFLWATIQHLAIAMEVMKAWGFEYKSHLIWRKPSIGLGRWIRSVHELLLIGTRGKIPAPAPGTQWDSVIDAARGEHSAKPEIFYELIEAYFPNLPKIELNLRGLPRSGWDGWGFEAKAAE